MDHADSFRQASVSGQRTAAERLCEGDVDHAREEKLRKLYRSHASPYSGGYRQRLRSITQTVLFFFHTGKTKSQLFFLPRIFLVLRDGCAGLAPAECMMNDGARRRPYVFTQKSLLILLELPPARAAGGGGADGGSALGGPHDAGIGQDLGRAGGPYL
jgi:hypothetical protein